MLKRLFVLLAIGAAVGILVIACGPDPKEQYAQEASQVVEEWRSIAADWRARPGDPQVQADFTSLRKRAEAIECPEEMQGMNSLLLQAMDTQEQSYEAYLKGNREQAAIMNGVALSTMEKYKKALQNLGLVE